MDDSLDHARRAVSRGENGEALVYLWNSLDEARASQDPGDFEDVATLAEKIIDRGDEAERADATRLLAEVDRARGEPVADDADDFVDISGDIEVHDVPAGKPPGKVGGFDLDIDVEPARDESGEGEPKKQGSALWGLIGFGVFLFFLLRDVFF